MKRRKRNMLAASEPNPLEIRTRYDSRDARNVFVGAHAVDVLGLTDRVGVVKTPLARAIRKLQDAGETVVQAPRGTPETEPLFSVGDVHLLPLPGDCTLVGKYQDIKDIMKAPRQVALAMKRAGVHPKWFPPGCSDV